MNDPEKTQPLLAEGANEEALQKQPVTFQERSSVLDEEVLEKVSGGGWNPLRCCFKPKVLKELPPASPRPASPPRSEDLYPITRSQRREFEKWGKSQHHSGPSSPASPGGQLSTESVTPR